MRKAVIDVGSNSVILLVQEKRDGGWVTVREETRVTALGEGTKQTGLLTERAMSSTLEALSDFFQIAKSLNATPVAMATMAARIASNAPDFLERAKQQETLVGILSGDDEAQLGFEAVSNDPKFRACDRLSIIDPGGQSTELTTASRTETGWDVHFRRSYPIGTLALRSGTLAAESPSSRELLLASAQLDDIIGLVYRPGQAGRAVVLGATGTNLVSIRERFTSWQPEAIHGAVLDYEEISKAVGWLSGMTDLQRRDVPGMEPGREKTIHLGALILERFLHALRVLDCAVSIRGWRYALLENDGDPAKLAETLHQ